MNQLELFTPLDPSRTRIRGRYGCSSSQIQLRETPRRCRRPEPEFAAIQPPTLLISSPRSPRIPYKSLNSAFAMRRSAPGRYANTQRKGPPSMSPLLWRCPSVTRRKSPHAAPSATLSRIVYRSWPARVSRFQPCAFSHKTHLRIRALYTTARYPTPFVPVNSYPWGANL